MTTNIYNIVAFNKKNAITTGRDGEKLVKFTREAKAFTELYGELQYIDSYIAPDALIKLVCVGLANIKITLDFLNVIKKEGCLVQNIEISYVDKIFNNETVNVMQLTCDVKPSISMDKIVRVNKGFKARYTGI